MGAFKWAWKSSEASLQNMLDLLLALMTLADEFEKLDTQKERFSNSLKWASRVRKLLLLNFPPLLIEGMKATKTTMDIGATAGFTSEDLAGCRLRWIVLTSIYVQMGVIKKSPRRTKL